MNAPEPLVVHVRLPRELMRLVDIYAAVSELERPQAMEALLTAALAGIDLEALVRQALRPNGTDNIGTPQTIQPGSSFASSNEGEEEEPAAPARVVVEEPVKQDDAGLPPVCTCPVYWSQKVAHFDASVANEGHHDNCPMYRKGAHRYAAKAHRAHKQAGAA